MLPDDSASNVESVASPPPLVAMPARAAGAPYSSSTSAYGQTRPLPPTATPAAAIGSFYSALAGQRKAQHDQLAEELKRSQQRIADMAYAYRYSNSAARTPAEEKRHSTQHRKEPPYTNSNGGWGQDTKYSGQGSWAQWGATAAPAPSEANATRTDYKSSKKEKKKGKERKKDSDGWATDVDDPWCGGAGGGIWAKEADEWGDNEDWDAPQAGPSKKRTGGVWEETDPWANPAPALDTSTSWGAWGTEPTEVEKREDKRVHFLFVLVHSDAQAVVSLAE